MQAFCRDPHAGAMDVDAVRSAALRQTGEEVRPVLCDAWLGMAVRLEECKGQRDELQEKIMHLVLIAHIGP